MTHESADAMLKGYKFAKGRCQHLEVMIGLLRNRIASERDKIAEDVAAVGAQKITDMPRGTDIGNPTERSGIKLALGWEPEHIKELERELAETSRERAELSLTVLFVESWLDGLSERERWVIEQQVIDGVYWKEIVSHYHTIYHEEVSLDTLKRLRNRALDKIYKMAE